MSVFTLNVGPFFNVKLSPSVIFSQIPHFVFLHLRTLGTSSLASSSNFALVRICFKFLGYRLIFIIFAFARMSPIFLSFPNIGRFV